MGRIKFKPGDRVKRIANSWHGMKSGDIGTIKEIKNHGHLYFNEYAGGHGQQNFIIVLRSFEF